MKIFLFAFSTLIVFSTKAQSTIEEVAHCLSKHKYKKVYKSFDDNMKSKISKAKLEEIWVQMEKVSGNLTAMEDVTSTSVDGGVRQTAVLKFDQSALKLSLSENKEGKLSGLFISQLGYQQPKYAEGLGVGKKYINFNSHSFNMSGELVIPLDCKNCPVVIFVHGSGPNDKDETIGPNKVFYDLAMGLASKGVASYRYDKRSKLYPETVAGQFDLYDETINDAISAFRIIKSDTSLKFGKYVMLGHSLGAYAMPLIADSLGDELNGAILFSSNARKLEDLIEYQMNYLTNFDGELTSEEQKVIKENTQRAENIRTDNFTNETSAENLLAYWPGTFWKGIANYSPVSTLKQNKTTPFYILQGEKDYQITMTDFEIWRSEVGAQSNVTMMSYPGLTHLFTPTESVKSGPQDYFLPNNVDFKVIFDIADWVRLATTSN